MRVPLLDLTAQHVALRDELRTAIATVFDGQSFILGSAVADFEDLVSAKLGGGSRCIGVSSGSDAVLMALMAIGVGPGDEVITTPFSFFATVEAIIRVGATPVFADIEADTFNLSPERAAEALSSKTKALLVVHLFGKPARLDRFEALASQSGVALVEDAAQAFGVTYRGRAVGTWGAIGCFSFFPAKPLGAMGDAGLLAVQDPGLADRCRRLRVHGAVERHVHLEIGGNFRLDAVQATVLAVKLPHLEHWLFARRQHALAYSRAFAGLDGLEVPIGSLEQMPVANYTVRVAAGRRDELSAYLASRGVETAVHYPRALHEQPALAYLGLTPGSFPEAERAATEVLSLPLYPELDASQHEYVVEHVRRFFESPRSSRRGSRENQDAALTSTKNLLEDPDASRATRDETQS